MNETSLNNSKILICQLPLDKSKIVGRFRSNYASRGSDQLDRCILMKKISNPITVKNPFNGELFEFSPMERLSRFVSPELHVSMAIEGQIPNSELTAPEKEAMQLRSENNYQSISVLKKYLASAAPRLQRIFGDQYGDLIALAADSEKAQFQDLKNPNGFFNDVGFFANPEILENLNLALPTLELLSQNLEIQTIRHAALDKWWTQEDAFKESGNSKGRILPIISQVKQMFSELPPAKQAEILLQAKPLWPILKKIQGKVITYAVAPITHQNRFTNYLYPIANIKMHEIDAALRKPKQISAYNRREDICLGSTVLLGALLVFAVAAWMLSRPAFGTFPNRTEL